MALAFGLVGFKENIMFISKEEKAYILRRIVLLEEAVKQLTALQDSKTIASKERGVKGWTPEARAIHSERMKLMWAKRKSIKAAT